MTRNRQMEKINRIALLLSVLLVILTVPFHTHAVAAKSEAKPLRLYVQNKEVKTAVAPIISGGRVYVEFRSVALALGFKLGYDAAKKVITAESEDASIKIDTKTGEAYLNDRPYLDDWGRPLVIVSEGRTMVLGNFFLATGYIQVDYYTVTGIVDVHEDAGGKPKKSDLRAIRAVIEDDLQGDVGIAAISELQLLSWGSYTTVKLDISIPKTGDELLDRIEHGTFEMERGSDKRWSIHEKYFETEYLDYKSLAQKEAQDIPEADKAAILGVLAAAEKADNEENAKSAIALLLPDDPEEDVEAYRTQMQEIYEAGYLEYDFEAKTEQAVIVSYSPDKARVYHVLNIRVRGKAVPFFRGYYITSLTKAADGHWYLNLDGEVWLGSDNLDRWIGNSGESA